ncbi:MAG: translocation/assembly module TamB domain-containing protein [bacterium]
MKRRRLVALVSAAVLLGLGLIAASAVLVVTRTQWGRDRLLSVFVQPFVSSRVHGGTIYIGRLGGNFLTYITVDSFSIRDKRGEYLVATGSVTANFSVRDFIDNRVYITRAEIAHPYLHLIQHENGDWNFKEIFRSTSPAPATPPAQTSNARGLGDYIVIDSTFARNASFYITMPWRPDTAFHGASRDSLIKVHLTDPHKAVAKTFDGFGRTYAWTNASALLAHARLADPDSDRAFGQEFQIATLSADEFEPTFQFRRVRAKVQHLGDSIRFDIPHFDMPGSTGRGSGKVWWGDHVSYDIAIHGDSVSLDDVNWVYPTLPRTGGGTLDLLIKNDPKNPQVINFILAKMDVRSTKSHLTGDMSFGTGAPLLLVRNVDLRADPVDFDLLRTLAGAPFKQDWQGQLVGTVKARGGPLTNFVIDDANGVFHDAHVQGAVSRFSAKGELDILKPAYTVFHGFDVDVASLDLRTVEFLFPNFPPLGGFMSGTATLDSSWLDVRFANANLVHQDGPGEPSRFTGSGRVNLAEELVSYDVALEAQPVSMTMLSRSYAWIPLRGLFNGPIRAKGAAPDLEVSASLQGTSGTLTFDGRVDIDTVGGEGYHGRGQFSAIQLGAMLEKPKIPEGLLSGHYEVDVTGVTPSYSVVQGSASIGIQRTMFDSIRVGASDAHVRFAGGRMIVDSLSIPTTAGRLEASGALGLPAGTPDSLRLSFAVDSLGGLRRFIPNPDTTRLGAALTPPDSLSSGVLTLAGWLTGTFDSLNVRGKLRGTDIYFNRARGQALEASFDLRDVSRSFAGTLKVGIDTAVLAGIALDSLGLTLQIADSSHARFTAGVLSQNGPTAATTGTLSSTTGLKSMLAGATKTIVFDSLGLGIGDHKWQLASPARFTMDSARTTLDSLLLRNSDSAFIAVTADVPNVGPVVARLHASRIPLRDVGTLAQLRDTLTGMGDLTASASATKAQPKIAATATLSSVKYASVGIDQVAATAAYDTARVHATMELVFKGQTAVKGKASIPMDLSLFSYKWRANDSLSGSLVADSTDLALAQTFTNVVRDASGRLRANIELSGTPRAPLFNGIMSVANGSAYVQPLGVTMSGITASFSGKQTASGQDSIKIETLAALTDDKPVGRFRATGWVKNLIAKGGPPSFSVAVGASNFHAFDKRSLADLYITTTDSLRLVGTVSASTLTGALYVDQGSIFLADRDLARKQAVQFLGDSTINIEKPDVAPRWSMLMTNLNPSVTVTLGNDVRLRSSEVNVKLNGSLSLLTSTDLSTRRLPSSGQLVPVPALEGVLKTESGTYNLNLGLVQREFQVLPEGTVTFSGNPKNPTLDIRAKYDVKQYRDRDLGVLVHLYGPLLPNPLLEFGSTADYDIAQSDLLSYLITGKPGFDFAANAGAAQVVGSFLGPTLSAVAADKLRQTLGSRVTALQFQFGGYGDQDQGSILSQKNLSQYLYGATIGAETKLKNNLYLAVNTGLCQFSSEANGGRLDAFNSLGAKIEWRFRPELSVQAAKDPPSGARTCGPGQIGIGFVPTPPVYSFSLSHSWRF